MKLGKNNYKQVLNNLQKLTYLISKLDFFLVVTNRLGFQIYSLGFVTINYLVLIRVILKHMQYFIKI